MNSKKNTKTRKTTKKVVTQTEKKNVLNQKVSFFTGSLILITAFVIATSVIPSYKQDNQSALEVLFMTFIKDSDLTQASIEAENYRIEIYKRELDKVLTTQP